MSAAADLRGWFRAETGEIVNSLQFNGLVKNDNADTSNCLVYSVAVFIPGTEQDETFDEISLFSIEFPTYCPS